MIRSDLPVGTPGRRSHNDAPEGIAARRPGEDMSTATQKTPHQRRQEAVHAVQTVGRTRQHGDPMPFPRLADNAQESPNRPTDAGLGVRDQIKANSRKAGEDFAAKELKTRNGCAAKFGATVGIVLGVGAFGVVAGRINDARFNARADVKAAEHKLVEISPDGSSVDAVDATTIDEGASRVTVCVKSKGLPEAFSVDVQDGKFVADVQRDESADKLC